MVAMPDSPIFAALAASDRDGMASILSADPEAAVSRDANGISILMAARYRFDMRAVELIRAAGQPLDIFEATIVDDATRVRHLLTLDPSQVFHLSADGFSALHYAAFFGAPAAARVLVDVGAPIDKYSANDFGVMPLHSALAGRHREVCRILVDAGADVDAIQREGHRPLHLAVEHDDVELIEMLVAAGADRSLTNDVGETAVQSAERLGRSQAAARLRA